MDMGLRVAMEHVRKWTRARVSRWGMSEVDMGPRVAMGHIQLPQYRTISHCPNGVDEGDV